MAVETAITLIIGADQQLVIDVVDADGLPQVQTGWAEQFVLRSTDGRLVANKASGGSGVTIGNGAGTNTRATIELADTDTVGWAAGRAYEWAHWRTDDGTDVPLAYGQATLVKVAAQV